MGEGEKRESGNELDDSSSASVPNFRRRGCLYVCVYIFRERDRAYQQATGPAFSPQRTDGPRFTGGGFNLKPPAKAVA